jgi:hypothetical protein
MGWPQLVMFLKCPHSWEKQPLFAQPFQSGIPIIEIGALLPDFLYSNMLHYAISLCVHAAAFFIACKSLLDLARRRAVIIAVDIFTAAVFFHNLFKYRFQSRLPKNFSHFSRIGKKQAFGLMELNIRDRLPPLCPGCPTTLGHRAIFFAPRSRAITFWNIARSVGPSTNTNTLFMGRTSVQDILLPEFT